MLAVLDISVRVLTESTEPKLHLSNAQGMSGPSCIQFLNCGLDVVTCTHEGLDGRALFHSALQGDANKKNH